jgi:membrane associated rhomboid family serine protease
MLLLWFGMQVVSGVLEGAAGAAGGVAWYAHVGGFAAGVLLILVFPKRTRGRRRSR